MKWIIINSPKSIERDTSWDINTWLLWNQFQIFSKWDGIGWTGRNQYLIANDNRLEDI